ncbi:MAG: glycosyltransferase family 4 protein [Burkholderiaceae bacterium]
MKIAQVAPLFERVPPRAYGGTERVISYLTEELVRQGHEVTLFASGDSVTAARLVPAIDHNVRPDTGRPAWLAWHSIQMDQVAALADEFDVIHFHTDYLHFPLARRLATPHITTMHGRLDLPELGPLFAHFDDVPLVSISNSQRAPQPHANWQGTVHHGLPPSLYGFQARPDDYFAFVGRISPEKRIDRAIDIARRCGKRLVIGAKIDPADEPYFRQSIEPLLQSPLIEYIGEIGEPEKRQLLQNAAALLFPIDWPEPFGLVMIEAFCCGTPVIAYRHGSVPEVVEEGVTGFTVDSLEGAVRAAQRIGEIDRRRCRQAFEERFTVRHMAHAYLRIYQQAIAARQPHALRRPATVSRLAGAAGL